MTRMKQQVKYGRSGGTTMAAGLMGQFIQAVPARYVVKLTPSTDDVMTDEANVNEAVIIDIAKKFFF